MNPIFRVRKNTKVPYRAFFDMDGTLARFYDREDCLEHMFEEGFYENLGVHRKMLKTMEKMVAAFGIENVFIISACVDSPYCEEEKRIWLEKNIPIKLRPENIILVPCGVPKTDFIPGGVKETDLLIDDYNKNLGDWVDAGGTAIKAINPINHVRGTWKGHILYCDNKNNRETSVC